VWVDVFELQMNFQMFTQNSDFDAQSPVVGLIR